MCLFRLSNCLLCREITSSHPPHLPSSSPSCACAYTSGLGTIFIIEYCNPNGLCAPNGLDNDPPRPPVREMAIGAILPRTCKPIDPPTSSRPVSFVYPVPSVSVSIVTPVSGLSLSPLPAPHCPRCTPIARLPTVFPHAAHRTNPCTRPPPTLASRLDPTDNAASSNRLLSLLMKSMCSNARSNASFNATSSPARIVSTSPSDASSECDLSLSSSKSVSSLSTSPPR